MSNNEEHDFGFSLVSEEELKAMERQLQKDLVAVTGVSDQIKNDAIKALNGLFDKINPLLINLSRDEKKTHIYWPQRAQKIKEFQRKLKDYVAQELEKFK